MGSRGAYLVRDSSPPRMAHAVIWQRVRKTGWWKPVVVNMYLFVIRMAMLEPYLWGVTQKGWTVHPGLKSEGHPQQTGV